MSTAEDITYKYKEYESRQHFYNTECIYIRVRYQSE